MCGLKGVMPRVKLDARSLARVSFQRVCCFHSLLPFARTPPLNGESAAPDTFGNGRSDARTSTTRGKYNGNTQWITPSFECGGETMLRRTAGISRLPFA